MPQDFIMLTNIHSVRVWLVAFEFGGSVVLRFAWLGAVGSHARRRPFMLKVALIYWTVKCASAHTHTHKCGASDPRWRSPHAEWFINSCVRVCVACGWQHMMWSRGCQMNNYAYPESLGHNAHRIQIAFRRHTRTQCMHVYTVYYIGMHCASALGLCCINNYQCYY